MPPQTTDFFFLACEPSGDMHGEGLLNSLNKTGKNFIIEGIGGPRMRQAGLKCFLPMEEFQVMGFIDILSSLPHLYSLFKCVRTYILKTKPKVVIFIDYPGFNLRLAKSLKRRKCLSKLIHFICPTVWIWGKKRIFTMEKSLDKLLTILPFEPPLFSSNKLSAEYIGHPLISKTGAHIYDPQWRRTYHIHPTQTLISIFPGSREKELKRNFPLQLKCAKKLIKGKKDFSILVSLSSKKFLPFFKKYLDQNIILIDQKHLYELMRETHLALSTSGTVTLELALHKVPTVVTYAITPIDFFLATKVFHIHSPYYALPNIIASKEIYAELFGPKLTEESLFHQCQKLLLSQYNRMSCAQKCEIIKTLLGSQNTNDEATKILLKERD